MTAEQAAEETWHAIRARQDGQFAIGLAADQEKDKKKRIEARAAALEKAIAEDYLKQKQSILSNLPTEPTLSALDTSTVKVSLPTGKRYSRRFHLSSPTKFIWMWIYSLPETPIQFKVLKGAPNQMKLECINQFNDMTILSCALPRELLYVASHGEDKLTSLYKVYKIEEIIIVTHFDLFLSLFSR